MKPLYWIFLSTIFACQQNNSQVKDSPDAYRDLLIDRVAWKKSDVPGPRETPMNLHQFTITNTSEAYSYRQIEVRFDYFDSTYHKIGSSKKILDQTIKPRAAVKIDKIRDGLIQPAATSATVTIVTAISSREESE